jgi:hypothetical protein
MEYGVNVNFLTNFTFEYSYSDKVTSDQILASQFGGQAIGTSGRTPVSSPVHARSLARRRTALKKDFFWRMNVVSDRTRQRSPVSTSVVPRGAGRTMATPASSASPRDRSSASSTARAGSDEEQLARRSEGSDRHRRRLPQERRGFFVRKSQHRTVSEVPLKFYNEAGESLGTIGDVTPDFTLGLSSTLQWKALTFAAQLNWVEGGNIYNYTRQWPFNEFRDPAIDQRSKPAEARKPTTYYSTFYNNFDANEYFVKRHVHAPARTVREPVGTEVVDVEGRTRR